MPRDGGSARESGWPRIDRGKIVIAPIAPDDACLTTVRKAPRAATAATRSSYYEYRDIDTIKNFGVPENIAQIDADRLQFLLTLRMLARRRLVQLPGMTGRKRCRLPRRRQGLRAEKQRQFVLLLSGDEIVCLSDAASTTATALRPTRENVRCITKEIA